MDFVDLSQPVLVLLPSSNITMYFEEGWWIGHFCMHTCVPKNKIVHSDGCHLLRRVLSKMLQPLPSARHDLGNLTPSKQALQAFGHGAIDQSRRRCAIYLT